MKLKIALVFGGPSVEHEVSVISALQAKESLDREKYDVIPVYMTKTGEFYAGEGVGDIASYKDIPALLAKSSRVIFVNDGGPKLAHYPPKHFGSNIFADIDLVLPVVHGTNVEDGALQGYFRTLGVPFAGCDVTSSAVGMDKFVMKTVFAANGIPVLPCLRFFTRDYAQPEKIIACVKRKFSYPVIVKPVDLGSSVGITIAHTDEELLSALDTAFTYARCVLVERAVTALREINCAVLGDADDAGASECEEPFHSDDKQILSFGDKYKRQGGKKSGEPGGMAGLSRRIPADLTPERREEIRKMAVDAFLALDCCGVARIDFMIDEDEDKVYLNEINTIPGSLAFYLFEPIGLPYAQLLDRIIDLALKRRRDQSAVTYSFDSNLLSGNISFGGSKK